MPEYWGRWDIKAIAGGRYFFSKSAILEPFWQACISVKTASILKNRFFPERGAFPHAGTVWILRIEAILEDPWGHENWSRFKYFFHSWTTKLYLYFHIFTFFRDIDIIIGKFMYLSIFLPNFLVMFQVWLKKKHYLACISRTGWPTTSALSALAGPHPPSSAASSVIG